MEPSRVLTGPPRASPAPASGATQSEVKARSGGYGGPDFLETPMCN